MSFSGGGIRSNAFQLGLLSGLYEKNFLKKVDYISAVSGGSWAAGAYKAYAKNDRELFEALDAIVRRDDLEITNDKHMRPLFNSYEKALDEIISSKKDILDFHLGSPSQEDWRKMLRTNVLNNNDILLDQLNKKKGAARPFIIFNATHDYAYSPIKYENENIEKKFPFEITSDFVGTLADCGNIGTGDCSSGDSNLHYMGIFTSTTHPELTPLFVSYAMAISGAVIPPRTFFFPVNILEWKLEIPPIDSEQKLYRDKMMLSDGGHSENLGVLALMERKVPRIIISDISYDPDNPKEELEILNHYADNFFGMKIELDPKQKNTGKKGYQEIFKYNYCWKDLNCTDHPIGTILYIRPQFYDTPNGFQYYLKKDPGTSHLRTYLDTLFAVTDIKFPTDKTLAVSYEYKLIFCYYLLGRYFATELLKPELIKEKWLEEKTAKQ